MVQSYSPGGGKLSSHDCTLAPPGEYDWTSCASFGLPMSTTHTVNRSVKPFLHSSRQTVVKNIGATSWIRLIFCILQPTRVHNQNRKSIGSAVFERQFIKRFALSYQTIVCLCCTVLYVTSVYCSQTVGWIKMPHGTQVGLGPGHTVLDGDPAGIFRRFCCYNQKHDTLPTVFLLILSTDLFHINISRS